MMAKFARCWPPGARPALVLAALALALSARGVAIAGDGWCQEDPVVKIDGKVADVVISSTIQAEDLATGPTRLMVTVPVGVDAELLAADKGFGHFGYAVTFVESTTLTATAGSTTVKVDVYVPSADGSLPIRIDFLPRSSPLGSASAVGTANAWVSLATS